MLKRLRLLLLALLISSIPSLAQQGNVVMIVFPGVPSDTCSSTMVALDVSNGEFYSCNGSAWLKVGPGAAGAVTWNSVTNPDGNQSLTMAAFTTTFTWGATTGAGVDMLSLLDTTGNTGTGYVLSVSTTGTSAAKAIRITDGGTADGVEMTTAGVFQAIGTGSILADNLVAGTINALTDFAAALCGTSEILEDQGASWACISTPSGGSWSGLTDPTAVTVFNSGAITELFQLNYTANYGATDVLFDVKQLTGNPLAGSILARFTVNDPDMLAFAINDGTNDVVTMNRLGRFDFNNFADAGMFHQFSSGATTGQLIELQFADQSAIKWILRKRADNDFVIHDSSVTVNRTRYLAGSNTNYATGSATADHDFFSSAALHFTIHGDSDKISWGAARDVSLERTSDPNTVLGVAQTAGSVFGLPVIAADPNTATWGTAQDGRIFFQSTANVPRIWDGAAIKEFSLLAQTIEPAEMDLTANYTWTGQHDYDTAEILSAIPIRFEGLTDDNIYTTITITDPTVGRTFTLPNADSNSVQPLTCTGDDKVSAISSLGVVTCSTDQTAGGANWEAITNLANTATLYTGDNNAETFTINWTSNWATDRFTVSQGAGNPTAGALVTISYSDTDITAFVINDGTDTIAVDSGTMNALTMFPTGAAEIHATEVLINVQKGSAGTITAGQVVHQSGFDAVDNVIEVELADADVSATMPAIGVAQQSITDTVSGHIVAFGTLVGIDTSSFSVGDDLYVSGTAGVLTATKPTGTALIQKVAQVGRSHVSLGVIEIFGAGRSNDLPNIANDNIWIGDGSGVPVASIITDCVDTGGNHLNYTQSTNAFACGTSVLATTVLTDQSNTYSTGDQSFASASSLTVPSAAGAAPTSSGDIRYDTTSFTLEYGDNGTNRLVANLDESQTFTNKVADGGLATTTHAAGANFLRGLRHATDCTAITDGQYGERCWEEDVNNIFVCENGAGCAVPGDWTALSAAASSLRWDQLTDPTAATNFLSNAAAETIDYQFQFAFTTGNQVAIRQNTGNPSGGTLFAVTAADTDVIVANFGDGTNGVTINQEGDLTVALGTITADNNNLDLTATWNNGAITFTGLLTANVVNTASAADSLLFDFQVGGVSQVKGDKDGDFTALGIITGASFSSSSSGLGSIELDDLDNSNKITIEAQDVIATNLTVEMPNAVGTTGQPLVATVSGAVMTLNPAVLGIVGGGTGQTTANPAFNALSPVTTEGDIIFRNATVNARLARGVDGECLKATATTIAYGSCGGAAWNELTDPTAAVTMNSDANAELVQFNYTSALGATDVAFQIEQLTGNPVAGSILLELVAADTDILLLSAGSGANTIDITQAGAMSAQGTATITATDLAADALDALTEIAASLCAASQILERQGSVWACIATPAGGVVRWDELTDPTGATLFTSSAIAETYTIDFQAAFTTGNQLDITQTVGNPSGGFLVGMTVADTDVTNLLLAATATAQPVMLIDMDQPSVAGQRDSHSIDITGTAFDSVGHDSDWRIFVDVVSNAGSSELVFQERIDAAGFATSLRILDDGALVLSGNMTAEGEMSFKDGTGFFGIFNHAITSNQTWTFPDATGTVALTVTASAAGDISGSVSAGYNIDAGVVDTTEMAVDAVDDTILRNSAGFSVIGKTDTGTGNPADIVAADETVLGRTAAGNLVFAQLATGQIANSAVTSLKLATANKTFTKSIVVIDPTTTEDDKVQWMHGSAVTYTSVNCSTDTGTATIDMDHRVLTTPNTVGTDILTGTIVCDTNNQADGGFADATIPANVPVNLSITAVASTPGTVRIHITYTKD